MNDFNKILEERKILVADGAWGTEMIKMGLSPGLLRMSIGYTGSLAAGIGQIERAVRKVGLAS